MSTNKRSRSRNGCKNCKRSKVKCDEIKPSCSNCLKHSKKCDYSIELTWGGRPYKNPKIEKLNKIANLTRYQLLADDINSTEHIGKKELKDTKNKDPKVFIFENESAQTPASAPKPILPVIAATNPTTTVKCISIPTSIAQDATVPQTEMQPSLNPSDNLNYLIKMSNMKMKQPLLSKLCNKGNDNTQSLDPPPNTVHQPLINENISTNIQTVSSVLDSIFLEKSLFTDWNFLNEIDKPFETGLHEFSNNDLVPTNLDLNELDAFTVDLNETSNLSNALSDNLISLPLKDQQYRAHKSINLSPSSSITSNNDIHIEPIPRGLLPLPDLLLNVPLYYDSFQFYLSSTSSILTPADSLLYKDNPFKMVLPKLAMTNDALMSLIIAFGLSHKNSLLIKNGNSEAAISDEIIESLLSRALKDLLILLNNKETNISDLTLTIVMLFTSFLVFSYKSDKWKVHMNGAKQIFLLRGYNKPFNKLINENKENDEFLINNEIKKSKLLYFLIRWFAYIDIFTKLSSPLDPTSDELTEFLDKNNIDLNGHDAIVINSPVSDASSSPVFFSSPMSKSQSSEGINNNDIFDYEVNPTEDDLMKNESHQDIDYMLGFNLKLLPLFSKLCKLIKNVNYLRKVHIMKNQHFNVSPDIIENALLIQSKFQKLTYEKYLIASTNSHSKSINSIIASNQCFLQMGLIQLYRRVLLMPRDSKIIQKLCSSILQTITEFIDTTSPNSLSLILPLFIAGCECLDLNMRTSIIEKLNNFQSKGSVSAEFAIEIMVKCWHTGDDWCDIMTRENKVVVFL